MNRTTFREVAIPLVSLALLIVIGYLAYDRIVEDRVTPIGPNESRITSEGRLDLLPNEASAVLPEDLPVAPDAVEIARFDVATREGDIQGTRAYESDENIATERAAYEAYMGSKGWIITDRQEADGYAAILAEREGRQLLASFSARGERTAVTVTVVSQAATN